MVDQGPKLWWAMLWGKHSKVQLQGFVYDTYTLGNTVWVDRASVAPIAANDEYFNIGDE